MSPEDTTELAMMEKINQHHDTGWDDLTEEERHRGTAAESQWIVSQSAEAGAHDTHKHRQRQSHAPMPVPLLLPPCAPPFC